MTDIPFHLQLLTLADDRQLMITYKNFIHFPSIHLLNQTFESFKKGKWCKSYGQTEIREKNEVVKGKTKRPGD